jgi:simple sugar transport system permease protein
MRYVNVTVAGMLAGVAGMHLVQSASVFSRGMTNGRGFIALAAVLVGRHHPAGVSLAALLFGFFSAFGGHLQITQAQDLSPQLSGTLPYLLIIVVLAVAGFRPGRSTYLATPDEGDRP